MATMFKTKKRTKPKIIEIEEPEDIGQTSVEPCADPHSRPLTNVIEIESNAVISPEPPPSAPSEEECLFNPTGLANNSKTRMEFTSKVYLVLALQKSLFCALIALFTYIIPLCIFVALLAISHSIRRKFALTTLVIITASMSLLISYAITQSTAKAFLYSMGFSDVCDFGVVLGSKARMDFTKWKYISLIPITMIGSSILAPTLLNASLNHTIWPSIIMTAGSSYLACNTVPVIRHNDLKLEPNEYVFAATQLYLNPEQSVRHRLKKWFCGTDNRERSAYTSI